MCKIIKLTEYSKSIRIREVTLKTGKDRTLSRIP